MAFHGLTFPNQNVSSLDDGGFYRSFRGDGIIQGCEISNTNEAITIQAGWFIAGGRLIQIDGATTITFDEIPTSGYARLMVQIDSSQESTVEHFAQLSQIIEYSASVDGFNAPVQQDINLGGGTIYQIVLAVVQISGGNITSIYASLLYSNVTARGSNIQLFGGAGLPQSELDFLYDGDYTGKISNLAGSNIFFAKTTPNNASTHGLMLGGTNATLSANNGEIYLYPRGWNDGSYGVVIDNNGQLYHPNIEYGSYSASENVTAPANVTVSPAECTLGKAGLYLVYAVVRYSCSSGNATNRRLGVSSVSGAFGLNTTTFYNALTSAWEYACMFRWVATSDNEKVYLNWMGGGYNGTITAHNLSCFLIY